MAVLASNAVYDLVGWAKQRDPDGSMAMIAQLLSQSNEMVSDIIWSEANQPTSHRITQQIALPVTYTRQYNQPVQVSRGQSAQFDETMAILETWQELDHKILDLWNDKGQFLFQNSMGYFESITQKWANLFWYGDPSTDETQFLGMSPRYGTVNTSTAANAQNVIDGGGTGSDNTSMWLLTYSPRALYGIFPKGSPSGIEHKVYDNAVIQGTLGVGGTRLAAHQEYWCWNAGLALHDWRWCARLCNIDVSNLRAQSGATDLTDGMIDMVNRMPSLAMPPVTTTVPGASFAIPGKQVFVCNRTVRTALQKQMLNKANNQLTTMDWYGQKVMSFMNIPIRCSDQLANTEARVV